MSTRVLAHRKQFATAEFRIRKDPGLGRPWPVGQDAGGDQEIEDGMRNAWKHQSRWPARLREHVASLYLMDPQTYESVSTFLDEASGIHRY